MKIGFITQDADSLDLALRIQEEGHEVQLFCRSSMTNGSGLINRVDDAERVVQWAEMVIVDGTHSGKDVDRWLQLPATDLEGQRKGLTKLVWGPSTFSVKLERDRMFGIEAFKQCGIRVPEAHEFSSLKEVQTFLKQGGRWVMKHSGDQENSWQTFVGKDPHGQDLLDHLDDVETIKGTIILQRFIEGVEIGVGTFWNGRQWVKPFEYNLEHKKLCAGDLGPNTGEMGTVLWCKNGGRLVEETLLRATPLFQAHREYNYIDVNCIVNETGAYALEWTPRPGYPALLIHTELIAEPLAPLFHGITDGTKTGYKWHQGYAVGVVIATPTFPFPEGYTKHSQGLRIRGLEGIDSKHLHITEVSRDDRGLYVDGAVGYPLLITNKGLTVEQAQKRVMEDVKKVRMAGLFYRNDIGNRAKTDFANLKSWGYL